jgi:hypothetical protein
MKWFIKFSLSWLSAENELPFQGWGGEVSRARVTSLFET